MPELLSYAETQKLLDDMPPENKKLVEELIPSQISVTGVQRVLQTLLGERVSIRDLPAVLEGIAEAVGHTKNPFYITEHVRARLARQLCHANLAAGGYLPLLAMSPAWEQAFAESIVGQGEERQLAMAPSQLQQFHPDRCANASMKPAPRTKSAMPYQPASAPLCAVDHRTLPAPDGGDEPGTKSTPPVRLRTAGPGIRCPCAQPPPAPSSPFPARRRSCTGF